MTDAIEPQGGNLGNAARTPVIGFQSTSIPIVFFDVIGDVANILMANSSFFTMTGLAHSTVQGRSLISVLAKMTIASNVEPIHARLAEGQTTAWEIACQRPDGSTYFASALLHPVRNQVSAHQQYILSFYLHGEGLERTSHSAVESHAPYKHAPGFIATSEGPEHRFTFANDSYKQFVGLENIEGLTVADAMPEIAAQGFVAILDSVYQTGVPYIGEAIPINIPGTENAAPSRRYADFVYAPVRDAHLNIVGIFCEGYDVTEQQEAKASLRRLQTEMAHTSRVNAMGTMAATLAHELNQPLSAIANYTSGCLRLAKSQDIDIDLLRQALLSIEVAANRAGDIIRTLRGLTDRRIRSDEVFELKQVVEESINLVQSACSPETEVEAIIPADLTLHADRIQIQQVIINLLRNGCDAVSQSAIQKVTISAEVITDEIFVSVCDTGTGVSMEAAPGIFTWSQTTKEGGMGMGLSISRTIIESHGGRIWLEQSSNTGSVFQFSLPVQRTGSIVRTA